MANFPIVEQFILPSMGKVYNREINPNVSLRSMTTAEEMRRLGTSDRPLQQMASIIDDCLVDKPGISSYDMIMGDYVFLLQKLRVVTYGPDYKMELVCPLCKSISTEIVNLDDLFVMQYDKKVEQYKEFDLPKSKCHIKLRMQTPRMVDDVELQVKEFKRRSTSNELDSAYLFTLKSMIDEVNGTQMDTYQKDEFVKTLSMADANCITQYAEKLNNYIGIDTRLMFTCNSCKLEYTGNFRINNEFFRPSLDI